MITGLRGSELALDAGLEGALRQLAGGNNQALQILAEGGGRAFNTIDNDTGEVIDSLNPYTGAGVSASDMLAALSGASGTAAQAKAFDNFQYSPAAKFMQQEGEKSILRNASATGNLGGGAVNKDFIRFGQGLASQELGNQTQLLNVLAGRGFDATKFGANAKLSGTNMKTGLLDSFARTGAGIRSNQGSQGADLAFNYGLNKSLGRTRAGERIADKIDGTTSALASLQNQGGKDIESIVRDSSGNLAAVFQSLGQNLGLSQQQLAAMLANISTGQGTTVAGLPGIPGVQQGDNGMIDEIASVAGAWLLSDSRLKSNVERIGTYRGHSVYRWDWTNEAKPIVGDQPTVGVMAHELIDTNPEAVSVGEDGYLRVDYSRIH